MFNKSSAKIGGTVLVVALAITTMRAVPVDQFQAVDAEGRNQPLLCDGTDRVLTFSNFVTAQAWFEQIRWKDSGSFVIGMKFDAGKNVALSYRCSRT